MSRSPQDKLVKILLANGAGVHMYADTAVIQQVISHQKFVKFKDNGNDNIYLSIDAIAGFEVLDDRTDIEKVEQREEIQHQEGIPSS